MLTILWDNDGVLVDTEGLYFRACRDVLELVGVALSAEQFKEISLRRGESVFALAAERGVPAEEVARLRVRRDRLYADSLAAESPVVDGAAEVLRSLDGRFRMGVVTSSSREHFDVAHLRSGLLPYLDFVLAREDYPRAKPHPDGYVAALERYRLRPADCIVVEDSERGLAAAVGAGLECVMIATGWTGDGDFRLARRVLDSLREVPDEAARWAAERGADRCSRGCPSADPPAGD